MHAGDVEPTEAWEILKTDETAVLVDVRTPQEWTHIGVPDLSELGKDLLGISWVAFFALDPAPFVEALQKAGIQPDQTLLFICRSGARSGSAASTLTAAGFTRAHNVAHGFEGPADTAGRRATISGWQRDGLPWRRP